MKSRVCWCNTQLHVHRATNARVPAVCDAPGNPEPAPANVLFTVSHFALFRIFPPSCLSFPPFLSSSLLSCARANTAKIALFLYNAHIRRSYCNLVRSRFRVIGEEKYFHGCGAPTRERGRAGPLLFLFVASL